MFLPSPDAPRMPISRCAPLAALAILLLPQPAPVRAAPVDRCEVVGAARLEVDRQGGMIPLPGLADDGGSVTAVAVCGGRAAGVAWEVTGRQTVREGGDDRRALRLTRLSRSVPLDDAWSLTVGKTPRGWGVGYAAQPLDFLGQSRRPGDLEDRYHEREASVLAALDYTAGAVGYSLIVADTRQSREPQLQVIALAERQVGATHLVAVAQKPERMAPGLGGGFSSVIGAALELHGSAFFRQGSEHPVHRALLDNRPAFFGPSTFFAAGETPVGPWRRDSGRVYARWVVGGQWTHETGLNVVAEWLHDGARLSGAEWSRLRALTRFHASGAALGVPPAGVEGNLRHDARLLAPDGAMRDTAFLRLSRPFDGWDGEVRALVNAVDFSSALGLRVTVPLRGAARVWLDAAATVGRPGSEFGEVPAAGAITLATSITF